MTDQGEHIEADSLVSIREKIFLLSTNFLIVLIIFIDMLYFGGILNIEIDVLIVPNLFVLILAYISYEVKKRIKKRIRRISSLK